MSAQDIAALSAAIQRDGVVPILLLIIGALTVGAVRGWWVPGGAYTKLEKRCDRWQQLAMSALSEGDKAASLADFFREMNR